MKSSAFVASFAILSFAPLASFANEGFAPKNSGFRAGVDAENNLSLSSYEVFTAVRTPWSFDMTESFTLGAGIEIAAGVLTGEGDTGGYAKVAPSLELSYGDFPVTALVSSGPAIFSEDKFGDFDLGSHLQFISAIGFDWKIQQTWTIGYRFQHTSNADLGNPNPGLDMHTVSLGYTF